MSPRASAMLAAALVAGCDRGGPPFPSAEVLAAPVACPAPVLRSGGTNPAPDPAGACVRAERPSALDPVPPGPATAFGWVDLGQVTVGQVVPFEVPPGTASITLVEQAVQSTLDVVSGTSQGASFAVPNAAIPATLVDPGGAEIYSDYADKPADGAQALLFGGVPTAQAGVLAYPNTSAGLARVGAAGVAPGAWQVTVSDYAYECWRFAQPSPPQGGVTCDAASQRADGRYRLFLLTRPAAAAGAPHAIPASGAIDVAIHLVDAPTPVLGVTADGAPGDPAVRRMVAAYARFLANAGLCVGTVTFLDAPAWARSRFGAGVAAADSGPCGELSQLLATSIAGERTLDLFLVTRLTDPGQGGLAVVGVDGAIPGPATVNGTVVSGAVVSAEDLRVDGCPAGLDLGACGADKVGYVAAHESGHYLGLFHTSESDGGSFDPLGDTPTCACGPCGVSSAACAAGGFGLAAGACSRGRATCGGGANLMFWVVDPSVSAGGLSPEQGRVARASPLVRSP